MTKTKQQKKQKRHNRHNRNSRNYNKKTATTKMQNTRTGKDKTHEQQQHVVVHNQDKQKWWPKATTRQMLSYTRTAKHANTNNCQNNNNNENTTTNNKNKHKHNKQRQTEKKNKITKKQKQPAHQSVFSTPTRVTLNVLAPFANLATNQKKTLKNVGKFPTLASFFIFWFDAAHPWGGIRACWLDIWEPKYEWRYCNGYCMCSHNRR